VSAEAPTAPTASRRWKIARFALQVAVSLGLVWVVARRADIDVLSKLVAGLDWGLWAAGLALCLLVPVVSAARFRVFIGGLGASSSLASVLAVNLESTYVNLAVPGEVAGGVVRWYRISNALGGGARALAVVVVERVYDWAGLGAIAAVGAGALFDESASGRALRVAVVVCAGLVLVAAAALFFAFRSSRLRDGVLRRLAGGAVEGTWTSRVRATWTACAELTDRPAPLVRAAVLTVLAMSISLCGAVLMARAASVTVPFLPFAAATCAVVLVSQAPVTVAGVGLREASFPTMLAAWGVTSESALVLGMNAFAASLAVALAGGVVHWTGRATLSPTS
jgi:uncharacterized protein (TIRG00374 family)